jgi:hypothetical protein
MVSAEMRDNSSGYSEIIDAYERDGNFYGVVGVVLGSETASFEFGVDPGGYTSLRRILESRPFDSLPGAIYRYYFIGRYGKTLSGSDPLRIGIRVECGAKSKVLDFDCPTSLASNLRWFQSLRSMSEAASLKRID